MSGRVDPRVCQVAALRDSIDASGSIGSGFIIGDGRVLTAKHVIQPAHFEAAAWKVRPVGAADWTDAEVLATADGADIALLHIDPDLIELPAWAGTALLGKLSSSEPAEVRTVGFPRANKDTTEAEVTTRHPEDVRGELRPATGALGANVAIHISGSTPNHPDDTILWAGMSGAAVFAGRHIIGVIATEPTSYKPDRLTTATLDQITDDQTWQHLHITPEDLDYADQPTGLDAPYWQIEPGLGSLEILRPRYGLIPFSGRNQEIDTLTEWCDTEISGAVMLITGDGGEGKTRLAAELAHSLAIRGWTAGFLTETASTDDINSILSGPGPKLVIIDYADTRLEQTEYTAAVSSRASDTTRVLLLARQRGSWWQTLRFGPAGRLIARSSVLPLHGASVSAAERASIYSNAIAAIASHLAEKVPSIAPDLADDTFSSRLFIGLAALSAVDPGDRPEAGTVGEQLLSETVNREANRFWAPRATAHEGLNVDDITRRRAVATATLTTPGTEQEAVAVLEEIPGLHDQATAAAHWLHELLPGDDYLSPLEPDRLGEHLVASVLDDWPTFVDDIIQGGGLNQIARILTVLERASKHSPQAHHALAHLLDLRIEEIVVHIAQCNDASTGSILATAFDAVAEPERARRILDRLPGFSHPLVRLSIAVLTVLIDAETEPQASIDLRLRLSRSLTEASAHSQALAEVEAAISLCEKTPGMPSVLQAELHLQCAMARHILGLLSGSIESVDIAISTYQSLGGTDSDLLPSLANSLTVRATTLHQQGRTDKSLVAFEEALVIYRELTDPTPETVNKFASALNNYCLPLEKDGRLDMALEAIEEAVSLRRILARLRPDAYAEKLATSLNNLSNRLADLSRHRDGLEAVDEAVRICLALPTDQSSMVKAALARSHHNRSNRLFTLGDSKRAADDIDRAIALFHELAAVEPDAYAASLAQAIQIRSRRSRGNSGS